MPSLALFWRVCSVNPRWQKIFAFLDLLCCRRFASAFGSLLSNKDDLQNQASTSRASSHSKRRHWRAPYMNYFMTSTDLNITQKKNRLHNHLECSTPWHVKFWSEGKITSFEHKKFHKRKQIKDKASSPISISSFQTFENAVKFYTWRDYLNISNGCKKAFKRFWDRN